MVSSKLMSVLIIFEVSGFAIEIIQTIMQTAIVMLKNIDSKNTATVKTVAITSVEMTKKFFFVLYAIMPKIAISVNVKVYGNEQFRAEIKIKITGTEYTENAETSLLPPRGI
jgi:hypothetical protein